MRILLGVDIDPAGCGFPTRSIGISDGLDFPVGLIHNQINL